MLTLLDVSLVDAFSSIGPMIFVLGCVEVAKAHHRHHIVLSRLNRLLFLLNNRCRCASSSPILNVLSLRLCIWLGCCGSFTLNLSICSSSPLFFLQGDHLGSRELARSSALRVIPRVTL